MNQQYGRQDQKQISDDSWTRFWEALNRLQEDKSVTLMQWTGVKDWDDKDIYEGDIIELEDGLGLADRGTYEVGWSSGDAAIGLRGIYTQSDMYGLVVDLDPEEEFSTAYPVIDMLPLSKVVGNVHENPELVNRT